MATLNSEYAPPAVRFANLFPSPRLLNVGLTRTRVPTATPEDDRGEKAEPRRYFESGRCLSPYHGRAPLSPDVGPLDRFREIISGDFECGFC